MAEVRRILDESDYAYDDISKLEEELKDAGKINVVLVDWGIEPSELEKRLEKVEDLETKIGELEEELSELENL